MGRTKRTGQKRGNGNRSSSTSPAKKISDAAKREIAWNRSPERKRQELMRQFERELRAPQGVSSTPDYYLSWALTQSIKKESK